VPRRDDGFRGGGRGGRNVGNDGSKGSVGNKGRHFGRKCFGRVLKERGPHVFKLGEGLQFFRRRLNGA